MWGKLVIFIIIAIFVIYLIFSNCQQNDFDVGRKVKSRRYISPKQLYISPKQKKLNIKFDFLNKNKLMTIKLYYADWCDHCMTFKPVWDKLKRKYKDIINFVDVDCTNYNPDLPYVTGFPTIALYKNDNHVSNYEDSRSYDDFENFINSLN